MGQCSPKRNLLKQKTHLLIPTLALSSSVFAKLRLVMTRLFFYSTNKIRHILNVSENDLGTIYESHFKTNIFVKHIKL